MIGDIETKDAIVGGRVQGSIKASSRVELLGTCHVEGDIHSRRVKLDEGGRIDGSLSMSDHASLEPQESLKTAQNRPFGPKSA